jgi:hypothetical protein
MLRIVKSCISGRNEKGPPPVLTPVSWDIARGIVGTASALSPDSGTGIVEGKVAMIGVLDALTVCGRCANKLSVFACA